MVLVFFQILFLYFSKFPHRLCITFISRKKGRQKGTDMEKNADLISWPHLRFFVA